MHTLFFECSSGASGDMILSALFDMGVPAPRIGEQLHRLPVGEFSIEVKPTYRNGIRCSSLHIEYTANQPFRHLHTITESIHNAGYSSWVTENSIAVLRRIAEAEAHVHGEPIEKIHFHEIGALDTIIDIVGTCLCLEYLGCPDILFSTLTTGHGTIKTAHGTIPVPAPATVEIARGFCMKRLDVEDELLTPTGCALLTTLGTQSETTSTALMRTFGYGCGTKQFPHHPNVLRVIELQESAGHTQSGGLQRVCMLETDIDHISGEDMGFATRMCRENGALDVVWSPVYMKKGRPGYRLCVLCAPHLARSLTETIIAHTHTLGVRQHDLARRCAEREPGTAVFPAQSMFPNEKVATKSCRYHNIHFSKPEYESLAEIAKKYSVPLAQVRSAFNESCADMDFHK